MHENNDLLQLVSYPKEQLVQKIFNLTAQFSDLSITPQIIVSLISGQQISGKLIHYHVNSGDLLLLVTMDHLSQHRSAYLNINQVTAITLEDIVKYAHHFADNKISMPLHYEPITRLGLRKEIEAQTSQFNSDHGTSVTFEAEFDQELFIEQASNFVIKSFTELVINTFQEIAMDALGKEALEAYPVKIRITKGEELTINKNDDGLIIAVNSKDETMATYSKSELKGKIESIL